MTPDTLGEVYRYVPSVTEVLVGFGILGLGFLLFTILVRIAVPILTRDFTAPAPAPAPTPAPNPAPAP
ncbi:polysulfide reductase, partial [bacterium]|nr:polysulfide reductase [bacterium]